MQVFAVVGTRNDQHQEVIAQAITAYGKSNVYQTRHSLLIAANGDTTEEVARRIGIGDGVHNYNGIVILVNYYWGFYDKGVWEWLVTKSNGR